MGGMSIMAFAERHPDVFAERVAGVALIATTAGKMRPHRALSPLIPDRLGEVVAPRLITALANAPELVDSARSRGSNIGFLVADTFAFGKEAPAAQVEFLDGMLAGTPIEVLAEFFPSFGSLDKFAVLGAFSSVPTTIICGTKDKLTSVGAQPQDGRADRGRPPGRGTRLRPHGDLRVPRPGQRHPRAAVHRRPANDTAHDAHRTRPMNHVQLVGPERAGDVLSVILESFGGRPALDPPATATDETAASVAEALAEHGGLLAELDGVPAAALLFQPQDGWLGLRRVGVLALARRTGISQELVAAAEAEARARGLVGTRLVAREELPATVRFWTRLGYAEAGRNGPQIQLRRLLPFDLDLPDAETTQALGRRLAAELVTGDLVILTGDLGAGKTTLTQGLGAGLGVRGDVTSPTFVIARVHPSLGDGPELVHVDAYRLGGSAELDDLDLDTDLDLAVTVVEWGEGLAESLAADRLEVELRARLVGPDRGAAGDDHAGGLALARPRAAGETHWPAVRPADIGSGRAPRLRHRHHPGHRRPARRRAGRRVVRLRRGPAAR